MSEEYPDCFPSPDCMLRNPSSCSLVHECNDAWYDEWWYKCRGFPVPDSVKMIVVSKEKTTQDKPEKRIDNTKQTKRGENEK